MNNFGELRNKIALVTGSNYFIRSAIAKFLLDSEDQVID